MDKSVIPTTKIEIGKNEDKRVIEVYQWLTQQEDDEYLSLLTQGRDFSPDAEGNVSISTNASNIATARNYLIEHYCIGIKSEEFNVMRPDLRQELINNIEALHSKKK